MEKRKSKPKQKSKSVQSAGPRSKPKPKAKPKIAMYTLEDMVTKHVGPRGTPAREHYEFELQMSVFGALIRSVRLEKKLTQDELGALVGVKKAHISKIENGAHHARVDTLVKIFKALKADVRIQVRMKGRVLEMLRS